MSWVEAGFPRFDEIGAKPKDLLDQGVQSVEIRCAEPLLGCLEGLDLTDIHWLIAGGESGPGHRPVREVWLWDLHRRCQEAGVPFFFKQWGGVRKSKAGRDLDGKKYDGIPARVQLPVLDSGQRLAAIAHIEGLYSPAAGASEPSLIQER